MFELRKHNEFIGYILTKVNLLKTKQNKFLTSNRMVEVKEILHGKLHTGKLLT